MSTHDRFMSLAHCLHLDLDGAWPRDLVAAEHTVDGRAWGPRLRYCATSRGMEEFGEFLRSRPVKFRVFGSGDFHHLSALWLRGIEGPFTLVSFDNHPDWDIRPPRWGCGTWINRALELPNLEEVSIWGCGNFELNWPGYWWVNRRALRSQRLGVWPWTERLAPSGRRRWRGITREGWREDFRRFASALADRDVYVTVDLDCLNEAESATNWEQGLFTASDLVWALGEIRDHARIVGGDVCGAASQATYERPLQRLLALRDHPKKEPLSPADSAARNRRALDLIWPALAGRDDRDAHADQQHANP